MKKLTATVFLIALIAAAAYGQAPTLRIVTETPDLPSELFYGNVKVKPLRLRPGTNQVITIADYDFFITMQYVDMLKRFPESCVNNPQCGMNFYLNILNGCSPTDVECVKYTKGALAANFFRSPEFGRKGNYIMYMYMVSIGQRPATVAELNDPTKVQRPHYAEFFADLTTISTPNDDPALTEQKKAAFAEAWMTRQEVIDKYPASMSPTAFVDALLNLAGVTISNRQQLINDLTAGTKTRGQVLRLIAESPEVEAKFFRQSFVTMSYLGYLRRDPEVCTPGPNADQCGFIFHNARFLNPGDPDFIQNTMLRGFIESPEYFNRF